MSRAGGSPVRVAHLEFRLFQLLLANAGQVLPSERLLLHVWGEGASGDRQLLKQLVRRLHQKIEVDAGSPRYLVTAAGLGDDFRPDGEAREGE
ncbi:MAG: helix-turn-helix domain-containing protein [Thermoanaerobaculia bacterium]|nr:helix-turn-helix domain-containing protein [Thermoanaerobaculia bacterium]